MGKSVQQCLSTWLRHGSGRTVALFIFLQCSYGSSYAQVNHVGSSSVLSTKMLNPGAGYLSGNWSFCLWGHTESDTTKVT